MIAALDRLPPWQPGGLVSLWDMLKFDAGSFASLIMKITILQDMISGEPVKLPADWHPDLKVTSSAVDQELKAIRQLAESLHAGMTVKAVARIQRAVETDKTTYRELNRDLREVMGRLRDELDERLFYAMSVGANVYLQDTLPSFGKSSTAFPSSSYDLEEAGKCFALRRPTACVMHLMRALEMPLASLAAVFGIPASRQNWNKIIEQVESRMNRNQAAQWPAPISAGDLEFYAGAAFHFRSIKDAWRNHAMHGRAKYTEEQAEDVYRGVRSFMKQISERLSEPSIFD